MCNARGRIHARMQFELLEKLGKGSYGVVQKARHRQSNEMRALKKITYDKDGSVPSTIREIYLLRKMAGHDNIVRSSLHFCHHSLLLPALLITALLAAAADASIALVTVRTCLVQAA